MLLFTRPLPKLNTTALAFAKADIDAVGIATSYIVAISSESKAISDFFALNSVDIVIVTSVYAVDNAVVSTIETAIKNSATKTQDINSNTLPTLIAVGDATARKLRQRLSHYNDVSIAVPDVHTSEGILDMHQLDAVNGQQVVIIKGEGGRNVIAQSLQDKGCDVSTFCVYRREQLSSPVFTKRWKTSDVSGIIATSEAMALQLLAHYGNTLIDLPWLTVSERIASTLHNMGVKRVSVCQRATDGALIAWVKDNWEY